MSKALSFDLRVRVLAAVASGLSPSCGGRMVWREREQGDARPKALGGDRRSERIEAHAATILALLDETADITIDELRRRLGDKGLIFGDGTIRRFFKRHAITRKKRPRTPASRIAPIS